MNPNIGGLFYLTDEGQGAFLGCATSACMQHWNRLESNSACPGAMMVVEVPIDSFLVCSLLRNCEEELMQEVIV